MPLVVAGARSYDDHGSTWIERGSKRGERRGRGPPRKDRLERSESENRRTWRHYLARVRIKLLLRASCNRARFNAFDFRVRKCPPKRRLIIIFPLRDTRHDARRTCRLRLPLRIAGTTGETRSITDVADFAPVNYRRGWTAALNGTREIIIHH